MRTMNGIRSHRHEVYAEEVNKMSENDDKQKVLGDNIHTLALDHYRLKNYI